MKYVKHQSDGNWLLVVPEQEDDEYLKYHGIWKLVEHEKPHKSFELDRWKLIEHIQLQNSLRLVHRFYRPALIDSYEPDRPTIIDPSVNT